MALALVSTGASAAAARPADVCVVVNPLLDIGCGDERGAPPPPAVSAQEATEPEDPAPVRQMPTVPRYDPNRIAVTFKRGTSMQTIRAVIGRAGTTLELAVPKINAYLLGVEPEHRADALRSLRSSSAVASAAQELLADAADTTPDDSDWPQQEGLRVAGFPKAWDVTRGSSRVVVAVLDTGVDARQADLRGALVPGYDFVNADADPADDQGHGTAVAGVIAARSNNHEGAAGICWRCSVMPVKVLDSTGTGDDTLIAAGIVWAVDHGAQVINLSLGGPATSGELSAAIGYAAGKGVPIVAAAGNSGSTVPFYPAADPRAVSVAATTVADRRYSWSNFGSWVNVTAPGCNVAPVLSGGYGWFCGTSAATPLVTGLIALERSFAPAATPEQILSALMRAAVPLPEVVQYGRIDAGRTLSFLEPAPASTSTKAVYRGTIGARGGARTYKLDVGAGTLTATVRFNGGAKLALLLTPAQSTKPIARAAGTSPLRLQASVTAGTFSLRIAGGKKSTYVLTVSYPKRGGGAARRAA
jgi:subtilisin family serine protease